MKKRIVTTLLVAALCVSQILPAFAAGVSENEVAQAEEEMLVEQDNMEMSAEEASVPFYPNGVIPSTTTYGKDFELEFIIAPETPYCVAVFDAAGNQFTGIAEKSKKADANKNMVYVSVTMPIKNKDLGAYTLKYWVGESLSAVPEDATEVPFRICKSVNEADNKDITKFEVVNPAYTGNEVLPVLNIIETVDGKATQLVKDKDYELKVVSDNVKGLGGSKVKVVGIGNYTGEVTKDFEIVPATPQITELVCGEEKTVSIKWNKVDAATGYKVERCLEKGVFTEIADIKDKETVSYVDKAEELQLGATYEYRIKAYAPSSVEKDKTVVSNVSETGEKLVLKPALVKFDKMENVSATKFQLTWTPVKGASGYIIYQKINDNKYKKIKTITKGETASYKTSKNVVCGQTYTYVIKAYALAADGTTKVYGDFDAAGISLKAQPTPVELKKAESVDYNKVQLTWKKVKDANGYIVYRRLAGEDEAWKKLKTIKDVDTLTYKAKAETGVKYEFAVAAYKKVDGASVIGSKTVTPLVAKAIPQTPTITANQYGSAVSVCIMNVKGADGYMIYRKENGKNKKVGTVEVADGERTYFNDKTMSFKHTYSYTVVAYTLDDDENKVKSKKSNALKISTK